LPAGFPGQQEAAVFPEVSFAVENVPDSLRKSPKMAGWQHELHVFDTRAAPFLKTGRLASPVRLFGHP